MFGTGPQNEETVMNHTQTTELKAFGQRQKADING